MMSEPYTGYSVSSALGIPVRRAFEVKPGRQHAVLLILCAIAAAEFVAIALAVRGSAAAYSALERPLWTLPVWSLVTTWGTLAMVAAVASWLAVIEWGWRYSEGLIVLNVSQLFFSALWHLLLFGRHLGLAALVVSMALCMITTLNVAALLPLRRRAAVLMAPFLAWTIYIVALTAEVWRLNPGSL